MWISKVCCTWSKISQPGNESSALVYVQQRQHLISQEAAERGDELFSGNQHSAEEMKIDSFEADRSPASIGATGKPVHGYRTMNLAGIFVRENGLFMNPQNKGRFYHDGRFATLLDTVKSYDARFKLGLSDQEEHDLVEYLKSL